MEWQELENKVRLIASYLWVCPASPETINGVKIDCVCKPKPNYWIIVEITKEKTLSKLRTDLAKLNNVRNYLFSQQIFPECYFICELEPRESLIQTGQGENITVLSFNSFQKRLIDYSVYSYLRAIKPFGSAINSESGEKDNITYVPVEYIDIHHEKKYRIEDLAKLLIDSKKIIMTGDYGTGKSRCMQELFLYFSSHKDQLSSYPLCINLRDQWGTKKGNEIIRRHLDDYGLSQNADSIIKVIPNGGTILLLDGFDEIGAQTWSDNPTKLKDIRAKSLIGVKDLINENKGGLIITGREHYFNSDSEMFKCLGLGPDSTILIQCTDEFTDEEMSHYLKNIGLNVPLPKWLPRRPLICKIMAGINQVILNSLMSEPSGEIDFWQHFIKSLCEREAQINIMLDADTIKNVLCEVANKTRTKSGDVGPISLLEINQAFEKATGNRPLDETAVILQRLPTLGRVLGRVESESPDRQFTDRYILDGLRAEYLIDSVYKGGEGIYNETWINPLRRFGINLVADNIITIQNFTNYYNLMNKASFNRNQVLAGDILAALCLCDDNLDLNNLMIHDSHISSFDLSGKTISGFSIKNSIIEDLDITGVQAKNIQIEDCIINYVYGVSSSRGLPEWIKHNAIDSYQNISTTASIRAAHLNDAQSIFLTIIKKTFFQPGSGRKEEALLRGLGSQPDNRLADKILNRLLNQNVLHRFKGNEGWVYTPNREFTPNMVAIRAQLKSSQDPLWKQLESI